eukprot:Gb_03144 [translate_table: standard]
MSLAQQCPLKNFKFYKSKEVPTSFYDIKTGFINRRTTWWDGSVIYGSNVEQSSKVRTFKDGKLNLGKNSIVVSGDVRNSMLHSSSKNIILPMTLPWKHILNKDLIIENEYLSSAIISTTEFLSSVEARIKKGMFKGINFSFFFLIFFLLNLHGKIKFYRIHFVGIYQMHSLMLDKRIVRDIHGTRQHNKTPPVLKEVELSHLIGIAGEVTLSNIGNKR